MLKNANTIEIYADSLDGLVYNGVKVVKNALIPIMEKEFNFSFKVGSIEKIDGKFIIRQFKINKSLIYLLPTLGKTSNYFKVNDYLLNTYLLNNYDLNSKDDHIYLQYRFNNSIEYINMLESLQLHPNFITRQTIKDTDVLKFQISNINYNKFLKGQYKDFSFAYKKKIMSFFSLTKDNKYYKILTNDAKLRKEMGQYFNCPIPKHLSLDDKPDFSNEILMKWS